MSGGWNWRASVGMSEVRAGPWSSRGRWCSASCSGPSPVFLGALTFTNLPLLWSSLGLVRLCRCAVPAGPSDRLPTDRSACALAAPATQATGLRIHCSELATCAPLLHSLSGPTRRVTRHLLLQRWWLAIGRQAPAAGHLGACQRRALARIRVAAPCSLCCPLCSCGAARPQSSQHAQVSPCRPLAF